MPRSVAIVDTGGANLASLTYALERLGAGWTITSDGAVIEAAERVILPGVGAAADAMSKLRGAGLAGLVGSLAQPVLGICLGLHLLARHSDEDDVACIGVLDDVVTKLPASHRQPVPHMGWNTARIVRDCELVAGIPNDAYFYFVHSYSLPVTADCVAATRYGTEFAAIVQRGNFLATQFHPERSSSNGARILRNFLEMRSC